MSLALLVGALALLPFFGLSFLPEFHEGNYIIAMTTLPGTNLEESMRLGAGAQGSCSNTSRWSRSISAPGAAELDEDAQPPNFSEFDVRLDFDKDPSMPAGDRTASAGRADLAGNSGRRVQRRPVHRPSHGRGAVRRARAGGDQDFRRRPRSALHAGSARYRPSSWSVAGAVDVNLEQQIRVPQVSIRVDRVRAARYGVRVGDVLQDVELYLNGETVSKVLEGQKTFDLYVRLAEPGRASVAAIRDLLDRCAGPGGRGGKVPLRELADISVEDEPYVINRETAKRRVVVSFNVQGRDLGSIISETQSKLAAEVKLPPGYYVEYGGQFQSQQEANRVLTGFGSIAVFVALMLLYKVFGTFRESLLVLFNLPLAMIGGIVALYFCGRRHERGGGHRLHHAVRHRGAQRHHPGHSLQPAAARGKSARRGGRARHARSSGAGADDRRHRRARPDSRCCGVRRSARNSNGPLAQVVLGGLVTSTFLNMVVIPTLYNRIERAETEVQTTIPATSTEIWRAIDGHIAELKGLIAKNTLKTVHQHAYAVRDLVRALPTHSPALSAAARSNVSAQVKFVDTLAVRLDASGDANDKTGTAANLAKLENVLKTIRMQYGLH